MKDKNIEPNFDPNGQLLADNIQHIVAAHPDISCVLALDAPLHVGQDTGIRRCKVLEKGTKSGWERRHCEEVLSQHASRLSGPWRKHLYIQSGNPIPPRIKRLLQALKDFSLFLGKKESEKQIIEIFPSEAIWALGMNNHYRNAIAEHSEDTEKLAAKTRAYKKKKSGKLSDCEAKKIVHLTLSGFGDLLPDIEKLTEEVLWPHIKKKQSHNQNGYIKVNKGFDDTVDSAISFFTAACFAVNKYHQWGDGRDGVIIGPGEKPKE